MDKNALQTAAARYADSFAAIVAPGMAEGEPLPETGMTKREYARRRLVHYFRSAFEQGAEWQEKNLAK